jgi:hypothetical protein
VIFRLEWPPFVVFNDAIPGPEMRVHIVSPNVKDFNRRRAASSAPTLPSTRDLKKNNRRKKRSFDLLLNLPFFVLTQTLALL